MYAPVEAVLALPVPPQLASWDAASAPSQRKLLAYLEEGERLLLPALSNTPEPLGLALHVGLPAHVDVLHERDLDNYLLPLARHLERTSGRTLTTVTGSKKHADTSYVGVGRATPAVAPAMGSLPPVRTTASAESAAYKQQIRDALTGTTPLPAGPVSLDITFRVGPTRSWLNLWKPTIDALGKLLGESRTDRSWHPRDGRIVHLALHRQLDTSLGHTVELLFAASPAED